MSPGRALGKEFLKKIISLPSVSREGTRQRIFFLKKDNSLSSASGNGTRQRIFQTNNNFFAKCPPKGHSAKQPLVRNRRHGNFSLPRAPGVFAECPIKGTRQRTLYRRNICREHFAECLRHSAKQLFPVVTAVYVYLLFFLGNHLVHFINLKIKKVTSFARGFNNEGTIIF